MKKLTLLLILGLLPHGANAARNGPSSCDSTSNIPAGYCCIQYVENGNVVERLWKCDNLDLNASSMAACKSEKANCIDYCKTYDLDNDTCNNNITTDPCAGWQLVESEIYGTNCTIPNALYCEYERYCDLCGNNCYNEDEEVTECMDGYYNTEDWMQCLKCPGNGRSDPNRGNIGIAQCYIAPTPPLSGTDATGTWEYKGDKCYYQK